MDKRRGMRRPGLSSGKPYPDSCSVDLSSLLLSHICLLSLIVACHLISCAFNRESKSLAAPHPPPQAPNPSKLCLYLPDLSIPCPPAPHLSHPLNLAYGYTTLNKVPVVAPRFPEKFPGLLPSTTRRPQAPLEWRTTRHLASEAATTMQRMTPPLSSSELELVLVVLVLVHFQPPPSPNRQPQQQRQQRHQPLTWAFRLAQITTNKEIQILDQRIGCQQKDQYNSNQSTE